MTHAKSLALLSLAFAATLPAAAQSADVNPAGPSAVDYPLVDNNFGATKAAFVFTNGGTNPQAGGCGGNQFSAIEAGLTTFGLGMQTTAVNSVADDFTVPGGQAWDLTNIKWLTYQTGGPAAGAITSVLVSVVPGANPNGVALPGGGSHAFTQAFSGIYRVNPPTVANCDRAMVELTIDMTWVPVLAPGQYWVTVSCTGSASFSGPWVPVTVPWLATDNGQQNIAGAGFLPTNAGFGAAPVDFPFALSGDNGLGGGATQYCAQTKATTVPACTALFSVTDLSLATGTWNTTNIPSITAGSTLGIYIYTNGVGIGQSAFNTAVPFGTLCLSQFKRSSPTCAPASAPTAIGVCNAVNLTVAPNCGAGALGIAVGHDVNAQCWYRDPGAVGNANFSNAVFYTMQ